MPSLPYSLEALLLGRKREFAGIIPDGYSSALQIAAATLLPPFLPFATI